MNPELHEAAASGNLRLLHQIRDPQTVLFANATPQGNTVLLVATSFGQLEFARRVLSLCPDLLLRPNLKGESALHEAAKMGHLEIARLLVGQGNGQVSFLRMVDGDTGDTALHVAVRYNRSKVAKLLIGADVGLVDLVNKENVSPLYVAVAESFRDIMSSILDASPGAKSSGPKGLNALHAAVIQNSDDFIQMLVEKNPDMIKEPEEHGWTPLHYAAYKANIQAVRLFLEHDCSNAYAKTEDGETALHIAAAGGYIDVIDELIRWCPDIFECTNKRGRTAIHAAVVASKKNVVKFFLERPQFESIINTQDADGNSALHLVVIHLRLSIIPILATDARVLKTITNKALMTARDILPTCSIEQFRRHSPWAAEKIKYFLGDTFGVSYLNSVIHNSQKKDPKPDPNSASGTRSRHNPDPDEKTKSVLDVNIVIAVLIATMAFQAALQIPGGYDSNGNAVLAKEKYFKAFLVFNCLAFLLSMGALILLHAQLGIPNRYRRLRYRILAHILIFFALHALVLAFGTAMYVVLANSMIMARTTLIIVACSMVIHQIACIKALLRTRIVGTILQKPLIRMRLV